MDRVRQPDDRGARAVTAEQDKRQGRQHREFVRGVLQGMTFGRRVLGDNEGKGFVWATRRALNLARLPVTPELRAFWQQLERASCRIVDERGFSRK